MDIKRLSGPKTAAIIILAISFGVYPNALFNGFVYDARFVVLKNPWIKNIVYFPEIFSSNA
jgi:hypothetical protein